jgi:hypothetical protein
LIACVLGAVCGFFRVAVDVFDWFFGGLSPRGVVESKNHLLDIVIYPTVRYQQSLNIDWGME